MTTTPKSQPFYQPETSSASSADPLSRSQFIELINDRLKCGDYRTATFWAEKLMILRANQPNKERLADFAIYLSTINADQNWHTIVTFTNRHELLLTHLTFAYFYVNALFHRQLYTEIVQLPLGYLRQWEDVPYIAPENTAYIHMESNFEGNEEVQKELDNFALENKYEPQILLLLAKTYLIVQNRPAASGCLYNCLKVDPFCSEALHLSVESRLLPIDKIRHIYDNIGGENQVVLNYFRQILNVYDVNTPLDDQQQQASSTTISHETDLSTQATMAFRLYNQCMILDAYKITSFIFHNYGYSEKCILVHIGCLVNLGKVNELYALGHELVQLQPDNAITWYTVGCYYYATSQYTTAKKFLNKCTTMNSGFGEGWLAYGHSLYYVDEHEQAMNCYLRAMRIMEDQFEPLLYIAVEYCFSNNYKLANSFLRDAEELAHQNAIVFHERGTVAFMECDLERAESIFTEALQQITGKSGCSDIEAMLAVEVSDFWEPIYNNLGHTLRKLGKFKKAISVHSKSLVLSKNKAEAWSCIGICYASMESSNIDNIELAINAMNNALVLRPGDDLLKTAYEKLMNFISQHPIHDSIFEGGEENLDNMVNKARKQQKQEGYKRAHQLPCTAKNKVTPEGVTDFPFAALINAPSKALQKDRRRSLRSKPSLAK